MFPRLPSPSARKLSAALTFALASGVPHSSASFEAQVTPRILHQGVTCIVAGQHTILSALVEPADDLVTVKVYFRADIYPAFFYVEMVPSAERYQGVLPRATRDIESIVYYLEAVDRGFNSLRTEEFHPRVVQDASDCDEDDVKPAYLEGPGNITVGATAEGATMPPGFLTEGIVGTITAAGRAVAAGGGSGPLVAVGVAAGAAAGVGALVSGGGSDSTTSSVPLGGVTTTTAPVPTTTTTTPAVSVVDACFQTEPNPPRIPVGETVRFDATCSSPRDQIASYVWDFHDGREGREGRVINRVYPSPGVFTAELTVTDIHGVQDRVEKDVHVQEPTPPPGPGPGPGPGPTTTVPGSADLEITGLSFSPPTSVGAVEAYSISYRSNGPNVDPTVTVIVTFNAAGAGGAPSPVSTPGCGTSSGGGSLTVSCSIGSLAPSGTGSKTVSVSFPSIDTYQVTASIVGGTSDPAPGNNRRSVNTAVTLKADTALDLDFMSEIQSSAPGQAQATIEMNGGETTMTDDAGPRRHRMKLQPGSNVIVGHATGNHLEGALWKLDFSTTAGFVNGSLAVEAGDVAAFDGRSVVFRLSGRETRVRLRFRVEH